MVSRDLQAIRIVILGVGALGSSIAELLARSGCREITVVDPDVLHIGNIVRHSLTATDVGQAKAVAVARRIEGCNPNAAVRAWIGTLADIPSEVLLNVDVIVDCTGEDEVLERLSEREWDVPVRWVSASVGFAARRLFVFTAFARSFPQAAFVREIGAWLDEDRSSHDIGDFPWDAVGCWHPTFPADATDMQVLASATVKLVAESLHRAEPTLTVFGQNIQSGVFVGLTQLNGDDRA